MPSIPLSFKGLALFTPAGDMVYCIDPSKRLRWHSHLCAVVQDFLQLPEPPNFLIPCYTATVDRWVDRQTQTCHVVAEATPLVWRYRPLLNALFGLQNGVWDTAPLAPETCDPLLLLRYRQQFPQLWQPHNLALLLEERPDPGDIPVNPTGAVAFPGYVLRLFVAGNSATTRQTLQRLHQCLETALPCPYRLTVVDVLKQPQAAEVDGITATPTLLKLYPPPFRRLVGEWADPNCLLQFLEVAKA
jgi:circadian clock protein KaiB